MATIGLRDLYRAPITIGDGGVEEYGTPVKWRRQFRRSFPWRLPKRSFTRTTEPTKL